VEELGLGKVCLAVRERVGDNARDKRFMISGQDEKKKGLGEEKRKLKVGKRKIRQRGGTKTIF